MRGKRPGCTDSTCPSNDANSAFDHPCAKGAAVSDFINRHFKWFTLGPAAIVLLLLTVYPIINLFFMAVSTITFEQAQEVWAFTPMRNFQSLMNDEIFRIALWNTLVFAFASVIIETVFGLALAILVASVTYFKGIMRTVLIIPVLMPPVAIGSMWKLMYSYDFGVFNQFITFLGFAPSDGPTMPRSSRVSTMRAAFA